MGSRVEKAAMHLLKWLETLLRCSDVAAGLAFSLPVRFWLLGFTQSLLDQWKRGGQDVSRPASGLKNIEH